MILTKLKTISKCDISEKTYKDITSYNIPSLLETKCSDKLNIILYLLNRINNIKTHYYDEESIMERAKIYNYMVEELLDNSIEKCCIEYANGIECNGFDMDIYDIIKNLY